MSAEQISDEHRVLRMRQGEQHSIKRLNGCSMKAAYRAQHWKGGAKLTMCRNMISKADEKKRKGKRNTDKYNQFNTHLLRQLLE